MFYIKSMLRRLVDDEMVNDELGFSIFYPYRGMDVRNSNQFLPWLSLARTFYPLENSLPNSQ